MKKFKRTLTLWGICLLCPFSLNACGSAVIPGETETPSSAETYLQTTSDEDLIDCFLVAAEIRGNGKDMGFSDPADISSDELFRFANLSDDPDAHMSVTWYDKSDQMYYIPVADINKMLSVYLEGYVFNPAEVKYADYDSENDLLVARAIGFGSAHGLAFLDQKSALDRDTVLVRLRLTRDGIVEAYAEITAKITETGPKFLNCRQVNER
jgi:hypothetical protein